MGTGMHSDRLPVWLALQPPMMKIRKSGLPLFLATAWCARQAMALRAVPVLASGTMPRALSLPGAPGNGARPRRWVQIMRWEASGGSGGRCESFLARILRAETARRPLIGSWNCIGSPEVTEVTTFS